jgi:ubiquinol oxidase
VGPVSWNALGPKLVERSEQQVERRLLTGRKPMSTPEVFGPIGAALGERPPFGPIVRRSAAELVDEQRLTLATPRRDASRSARMLFTVMDLVYGKARTLEKFRVLELIARVPYQAWENVAYVAVTHTSRTPEFARRIFDRVRVNRWEQDNEQWHLFLLEELLANEPSRLGWWQRDAIPQMLAFSYFQLSWMLYAIRPTWSYRLNADFEDHAEHEYALAVQENHDWETTAVRSSFDADFGRYDSLAELFRQISLDERMHKLESEAMMGTPRFE